MSSILNLSLFSSDLLKGSDDSMDIEQSEALLIDSKEENFNNRDDDLENQIIDNVNENSDENSDEDSYDSVIEEMALTGSERVLDEILNHSSDDDVSPHNSNNLEMVDQAWLDIENDSDTQSIEDVFLIICSLIGVLLLSFRFYHFPH